MEADRRERENEERSEILTYPFDESATFGSHRTKSLGPTFLQALCICILSNTSDSEHKDTLPDAEVSLVRTPDQKPSRNVTSEEQVSKRSRTDKTDGQSSSGGSGGQSSGGGGHSKFLMRTVAGQPAYRCVRVLAEVDVQAIENLVASTEKARVS